MVSPAVRTEEALRSVATNRYNPPTAELGAGAESSDVVAADGAAASVTAAAAVVATSMSLSSTATIAGTGLEGGMGVGTGSSWLDEVGPDGRRKRRSKKQVGIPQSTYYFALSRRRLVLSRYHNTSY